MAASVSFSFRGRQFDGDLYRFPGFLVHGQRDLNVERLCAAFCISMNGRSSEARSVLNKLSLRVEALSIIQGALVGARNHSIRDKLLGLSMVAVHVGFVALSVFLRFNVLGVVALFLGAIAYMVVASHTYKQVLQILNPEDGVSPNCISVGDLLFDHLKLIHLFFTKISQFESAEQEAQTKLTAALEEFVGMWRTEGSNLRAGAIQLADCQRMAPLRMVDRYDELYNRLNESSTVDTPNRPTASATGGPAIIVSADGVLSRVRGTSEEDDFSADYACE